MDFKNIEEIDLKLGLLSGSSVVVDNLMIVPYTMEEIKDYGYTNYMRNLQWISVSIDDFISSIQDDNKRVILEQQKDNLRVFDFYAKLGGKELLDKLIVSLIMILRTDDVRVLEDGAIAVNYVKMGVLYEDEKGNMVVDEEYLNMLSAHEVTIIHRDNFDDLVEVVKIQNFLKKPKIKNEPKENPVDSETQKLMEDMERSRQKVESKKKAQKMSENGDEDDVDISDIISAVSSKSNSINILNIWMLTLYQVYDEYSRLELIDNYDFSIRAMMAGAEKVDLRHWSSKL